MIPDYDKDLPVDEQPSRFWRWMPWAVCVVCAAIMVFFLVLS